MRLRFGPGHRTTTVVPFVIDLGALATGAGHNQSSIKSKCEDTPVVPAHLVSLLRKTKLLDNHVRGLFAYSHGHAAGVGSHIAWRDAQISKLKALNTIDV